VSRSARPPRRSPVVAPRRSRCGSSAARGGDADPVADVPACGVARPRARDAVQLVGAPAAPRHARAATASVCSPHCALGFELASRGATRYCWSSGSRNRCNCCARCRRSSRRRNRDRRRRFAGGGGEPAAGELRHRFLDPPFRRRPAVPSIKLARCWPLAAHLREETDALIAPADAAVRGLEVVRSARAGRVCFHCCNRALPE